MTRETSVDLGVMSLPTKAKNKIEVTLEKSQHDRDTNPFDPRVFGLKTFNLVYGSRWTGKSCLLSYLVKRFYLDKKIFSSVLILTPSGGSDPAWNNIKNRKRVTIFNECNDKLLFDLIKQQEERIAQGIRKHVLLILDDFSLMCRNLKGLETIAVRGRHALITCICTTQSVSLLSPIIRRNAQSAVLFRLSDEEFETLGREGLRGFLSVREFVDWCKTHTSEPGSFVHCNTRDKKRPFSIGFSDPE